VDPMTHIIQDETASKREEAKGSALRSLDHVIVVEVAAVGVMMVVVGGGGGNTNSSRHGGSGGRGQKMMMIQMHMRKWCHRKPRAASRLRCRERGTSASGVRARLVFRLSVGAYHFGSPVSL